MQYKYLNNDRLRTEPNDERWSLKSPFLHIDDRLGQRINNNNNGSIYIAPWFHVTLFKGAVTSKKNGKKMVKILKKYNIKKCIKNIYQ